MAAIFAARAGARVVLLETTRDGGRKILISGGGRCNVLPRRIEPVRFVTDSSPHTLKRLLLAFPLEEQRAFFEADLGIPLALEEESGKFFPVSNRARDVRDGLIAAARAAGVTLRFGARVTDLRPIPEGWGVGIAGHGSLAARAVVLATGGLSVPTTGSDGAGLSILGALGHAIQPTYPALTPLIASPPIHAHLAGVSLPATVEAPGTRLLATGGFLFTHRGYSGPVVLDMSHLAVRSRLAGGARQSLLVRWGGLDDNDWDRELQERSGATVGSCLRRHLPARLAETLAAETGVAPDRPLSQLRREERRTLVARLVGYELPWSGDEGFRKAEVTGGGVALSEADPGTLQSRRCPGLYLCGELLDAFGPIGGHNFAWAWATGRTAGLAAGSA
jgi:predicted Rossmann fold flavoprotein